MQNARAEDRAGVKGTRAEGRVSAGNNLARTEARVPVPRRRPANPEPAAVPPGARPVAVGVTGAGAERHVPEVEMPATRIKDLQLEEHALEEHDACMVLGGKVVCRLVGKLLVGFDLSANPDSVGRRRAAVTGRDARVEVARVAPARELLFAGGVDRVHREPFQDHNEACEAVAYRRYLDRIKRLGIAGGRKLFGEVLLIEGGPLLHYPDF